jgi:hypothetical protein
MGLVLLVAALALVATVAIPNSGRLPGRWRAVRLLVAALVVQLVAVALAPDSGVARFTALGLTGVLAGLFLYGNRRAAGASLVVAGLLLNGLVITVNAGMPVSLRAADRAGVDRPDLRLEADALREPETSRTRLAVLGDVIPVALPARPEVVSPGDVLVAAGVGLLVLFGGARQTPRRIERSTVLVRDSTTTGSYS